VSMIEREIERLAPFERSVLEAASAAGMDFGTASLAAALDEDVMRVEELCLVWARRRQFFQLEGNGEWPDGTVVTRCAFIHAVYQQVAYARIGLARRAQLHLRIGMRQEAAYGERARDIAPELAMHFERGQEHTRAVFYLAAAGEQALRRSACQEAIAHYRRALELTSRLPPGPSHHRIELDLLVALGAPLAMTRGHAASEVEAVYARARELCDPEQVALQHFQAVMGVGAFYLVRGEYQGACVLGEQFLELAREQGDAGVRLQMSLLRGLSLIFLGDARGAQRELEHTIALYDPALHGSHIFLYMQDPCVCAHALVTLPSWILGRSAESLEHAQRALQLSQQLTHPAALALGFLSIAQIEVFCGDFEQAAEHVRAGLAVSGQYGFALYHQTLTMLEGEVLMGRGQPAAGAAAIEAGWLALCSTGAEFASARWRGVLAEAYARTGRAREAFALIGEALSRVRSHADRWWEPELYRVLGELLAQPANLALAEPALVHLEGPLSRDARGCFLRALALARQRQARAFELRAAVSLGRMWQTEGEVARARELLAEVCGGFADELVTSDRREARRLLAELSA
jgi:predicted ATPase